MNDWRGGFMKLKAWQVAQDVGLAIYGLASAFPHPHRVKLGSQIQAAAISMPTNIAEGFGRRHSRDKARFYDIAKASGDELKSLLLFAFGRALVRQGDLDSLMPRLDEACRLTQGLIDRMSTWEDP